jgi:predicted dehydrogenase
MDDLLKIGVIGAGAIASKHIRAWAALASDVRVVAVADVEFPRASQLAALVGATAYDDNATMLDNERVDAVDICVPPHAHVEIVTAAAARGVHVLCEKPIGRTLAEAQTIDEVCREASIIYLPGHNTLFYPTLRRAREIIDRGDLGPVRVVQSWDCASDVSSSRLGAEPPPQARLAPADNWRSQPRLAGGGALIDGGFHAVYRLLYLIPTKAVEVTALFGRFHEDLGWASDDTASVAVRFDGGEIGLITISYSMDILHTGQDRLFAIGARDGTLAGDGTTLLYRPIGWDVPAQLRLSSLPSKAAWERTFVDQASHFVGVIRCREPQRQTTADALAALRVVTAAYESVATGRHIQLAG